MISKSTETKKPVDLTVTGTFSLHKAGTSTEGAIALYQYDGWNQLVAVTAGDKAEKYQYNGEGYRVVKNDNGQITNYLYEYDKVILETNSAGAQTACNLYGINLISRTAGSNNLYYMYNGHADVTALIDNTGAVQASYYYDAFGNILDQTGSVNNNITYAGYQYDSETGLYYLNARYYDSKIARFLSEDTYRGSVADPLSLNLYMYCHNEPIMYWDPSGHWEQGDEDLNDEAKARIIAITNAYYEATTAAEREAIHNQAVTIRNDRSSYSPKVTPLTIESHSAITNAVNQGVAARGYMTKDEWVNAINSDGITYTTDTSYDVSSIGVKKDSNTVTSIGRTDIGVNVKSNLISMTASASMSLTYNLSYNEAKFVNSVINNSTYSLEQSICLLDIMEMNDGKITDSDLQGIVGDNYYTPEKWYEKLFDISTADVLELEYRATSNGYSIAEIDYMMQQQRLNEVYNLMYFQALCAASNTNLNIGPRDPYFMNVNGKNVAYTNPSGYIHSPYQTFGAPGSYITINSSGYSIVTNGTPKSATIENEWVGKSSKYEDITAKDSRYRNIQTDVTKTEFGKDLEAEGWTKSVSKDGKSTIYTKDGAKYAVRDYSNQGSITADFTPAGSSNPTLKIRLGGK